ncbi:MAG TPA: cell division ATP-binding protein FtsE [Candidatus Polarisedimenticolia bacterium]|jgi:cell division transport system ATP-binding protein|nr:cell division ATP-binding protein FtsE [Candidatus Polarisedimenticolia bacterium]
MVELYHVHKDYGRSSHALVDVSLEIGKGDFVFLTGASGAGKTTLLRLLLREEIATSGKILVDGMNVSTLPPSKVPQLRRRIGVVFQDFKLLPRKTVYENVALVMEILGVPQRIQRSRTFSVLEMLGLNHKVRSYPLQLSGGEQQRVAIARALVNEPKLLLADEPTGNLDPDLSWEIMTLFKEINIRGTTVLVATHDRDLIQRMGKRVLTLDCGRLITHELLRSKA